MNKNSLKKIKGKVKSVSKTIQRVLITGDRDNKRIAYREKRAPLEFRSFNREKETILKQMKDAKKNPDKYSEKRLARIKRRHLAATKKMSIKDERNFYRSRDSKGARRLIKGATALNIASYPLTPVAGAIGTAVGTPITGVVAANATNLAGSAAMYGSLGTVAAWKSRKSILDKRYAYMKKHGYVK